MHMPDARQRMVFPLVDVVRAFAALTVLVYHLIAHWEWDAFPTTGPLAWFRGGWMAVDVFFVISGFVIGLSAFARIDTQGAGFRGGFLRDRLARIVPLHWLALVAYVLLVEPSPWNGEDFWADLGAHLLFVHNWFPAFYGSINGPNWSLGTEMQFYLLMLMAAPWLRRANPLRLALALFLLAWAWRWGAWLLNPGAMDQAYMAQTQLPGMLDEFALGLLLARAVRSARGQSWLARLRGDARLRWGGAGVAALCWWTVLELHLAFDYWEEPAMAVFFRTGVAASAALTLFLLCGVPLAGRGAGVRVAQYLGKISYGIYLWHIPVLFLLGRHTQWEPLQALLVAVPATMAFAALTWHFFEAPLLRRWTGQRSLPPAPDAGARDTALPQAQRP